MSYKVLGNSILIKEGPNITSKMHTVVMIIVSLTITIYCLIGLPLMTTNRNHGCAPTQYCTMLLYD